MASSSTEFPSVALQAALAQAIATGTFSDTAYYLFTRRLNSSANHGKVGIPRAVYASSTVMQAAGQHFRGQLSAGFSSTNEVLRETDEYGYESDSDLEDEEWEDELVTASSGLSSPSNKGKEKAKLAEEGEEIDLGLQPIVSVERMVTPQLKHTVIVTDVAADTWQAMINYIYTGKIYFAPLRSQGTESRLQAIERHTNDHPYGPPLCSPKSIYRLADKVGLLSLQKLAEQDIKNKLLNMSILEEVFSKFSSRYPDILKIEVERIFTHGLSPNDMLLLQQKIKSVALGELPHATNAMMGLLERLPLGSGILASGSSKPTSTSLWGQPHATEPKDSWGKGVKHAEDTPDEKCHGKKSPWVEASRQVADAGEKQAYGGKDESSTVHYSKPKNKIHPWGGKI